MDNMDVDTPAEGTTGDASGQPVEAFSASTTSNILPATTTPASVATTPPFPQAIAPNAGSLRDPTKLTPNQIQHYVAIAHRRLTQIIKDWVPGPYTPTQMMEHRAETHRLMASIEAFTQAKAAVAPKIDNRIESNLFMARIDYRITFARIFRFHELPTEIICNIFHLVVWSTPDAKLSIKARLYLTWTCNTWRKIALEDPTLWNVIWWQDRPYFMRSREFLSRSADAPKDIRINDSPDDPMSIDTMRVILGQVMPRIHRVRIFIVLLQEWDTLLYIVDQLRALKLLTETPMCLERLELHRMGVPYIQLGNGYTGPYGEAMPLFGGKVISTLRNVSLSGVHVDWSRTFLSNLVVLDLRKIALNRAPSFNQFREMIGTSPNLTKLILDGAGPTYTGRDITKPFDFKPIPLPNLRSLALADFSVTYVVYLFSQFSAPNLLDFTILNLQGDDYSPFFHLMAGKMQDLRVLTVFNADLQEKEILPDGKRQADYATRFALVRWLESMPNINFLRFGSLASNFLDTFHTDPALMKPEFAKRLYPRNPILLPNLKYLEWQRMSAMTVVKWAKHRKDVLHAPLEKMYINDRTAADLAGETQIHQAMKECLAPDGNVFLLRAGHKAPEETALQRG